MTAPGDAAKSLLVENSTRHLLKKIVAGRPCSSSDQCEPFTEYCCVIKDRRSANGTCKYKGLQGHKCSNMLFRSNAYNNYYASYLYICPCQQPKYACHRKHGRHTFGTCEFYTSAKAGG
ncbi:hypothetical protein MTO96_052313 [Rhipicephalus appendiculatus]